MLVRDGYDVFVVMYYDQGYILVKLLVGRKFIVLLIGVNILFLSVGYGVVFDIVGKNCVDFEVVIRVVRFVGGVI